VAAAVDTQSWRLGDKFVTVAKLRAAATQWYYEAILPAVYQVARVTPGPPDGLRRASDYTCREAAPGKPVRHLLSGESESGQFPEITSFGPDGTPRSDIMALITNFDRHRGQGDYVTPPESLMAPLFRNIDDPRTGYGLQQIQFFSARIFAPFPAGVLVNDDTCPHSD
jgi:hypothetical protein